VQNKVKKEVGGYFVDKVYKVDIQMPGKWKFANLIEWLNINLINLINLINPYQPSSTKKPNTKRNHPDN